MGLFSRRQPPAPTTPPVDASLPDGPWFAASQQQYRDTVDGFYGSPESMARGGHEALARQDAGTALLFFGKSIDMLHTAYGFQGMSGRRPGSDDDAIVDGFTDALAATMASKPAAPVDEQVRETTHRLRSIAATCDGAGLPGARYRLALERMAASAPGVRTDDILWV